MTFKPLNVQISDSIYYLPPSDKLQWKQIDSSADKYHHFLIRASEFKKDVFIGFGSWFVRWKIILGGWEGTRSLIEAINSDASLDKICTNKSHSKDDFSKLKENFQVIVADKSITVQNHDDDQIFMKCSDEEISKFNLAHMYISSGIMQNSGQIHIGRGLFKL